MNSFSKSIKKKREKSIMIPILYLYYLYMGIAII